MGALKDHVTLADALEVEAIKCVAGDHRHAFNEFASTWYAEQRTASQGAPPVGALDLDAVVAELETVQMSIEQHEGILAEHREALVAGEESPYTPAFVDEAHAILESLRSNLPLYEATIAELMRARAKDG